MLTGADFSPRILLLAPVRSTHLCFLLLAAASCLSLPFCERHQWVVIPRRGASAFWPLSWWGQVPQGQTQLPNAGCPWINHLAVVAALLHTPIMGSSLLGKTLTCAKEPCPQLRCIFALSQSWQRLWSCLAVLTWISPIACRPTKSRLYPSHCTALQHQSLRWAAAWLPSSGRTLGQAGLQCTQSCRAGSVNLGGLGGRIPQKTSGMWK